MKQKRMAISGRAVVILGAGASRGEVRSPAQSAVLPPLDSDFFSQLQKLGPTHEAVNEVLGAARELFGPVPSVTMEQFFIRIEFLTSVARYFPGQSRTTADRYEKVQQAFREALLLVLNEARVGSGLQGGPGNPERHQFLFRHLDPGDTIISFNYDLVAEGALATMGGVPWNPASAYGVTATGAVDKWRGGHREDEDSSETVYLLKMHGSLNWRRENEELVLTVAPYDSSRFLIIPPAWNKPVEHDRIIRSVWQKARDALSQSEVLVIVGYSLPQTDMWTAALMRACADERSEPFSHVLIANPDWEAVDRLVSTVSPAIHRHTRVITFATFAELIDSLVRG
jgi:hypothetical protein